MRHSVSSKHCLQAYFILLSMMLGTPAYAYLEPGTANMLLQLILGGIGGIAVAVKLYWHNMVAVVRRFRKH